MNPETKENIRNLAQTYMSNPNAIILCIQAKLSEVKWKKNVFTLIGDPSPDHADCGSEIKLCPLSFSVSSLLQSRLK
jgi:hypothetical protein